MPDGSAGVRRLKRKGDGMGAKTVPALAAVLLTPVLLGGCAMTPLTTAMVAADGTSLNSTKKTLLDHVVSGATGKDCSTISFTETGTYCPEKVVVDRSRLYCYKTLADVECHHIPDPYKNGNTSLASPPPERRVLPREKGWLDEAGFAVDSNAN